MDANTSSNTSSNTFTCIECHGIRTQQGSSCTDCKKPICDRCTEKNHTRATSNSFYIQYKNHCDACIWFDIG